MDEIVKNLGSAVRPRQGHVGLGQFGKMTGNPLICFGSWHRPARSDKLKQER
jgi:hypothetical protein